MPRPDLNRPPSYLSRASLARELDISESTVDEMVRRGILPQPARLSTGCIRWSWDAVQAALASLQTGGDTADPFMAGVANVTKATARAGHG